MARPKINTIDDGATPQTREPISNIAIAAKKPHFAGKKLYILTYKMMVELDVKKYADPNQPTSLKDSNSFVIVGIAVAIIVSS
jgi:hypothetical protein